MILTHHCVAIAPNNARPRHQHDTFATLSIDSKLRDYNDSVVVTCRIYSRAEIYKVIDEFGLQLSPRKFTRRQADRAGPYNV